MDLIHGFIYSSQVPPAQPRANGFFARHRYTIGIALSLFVHFAIFAWIFYRGVVAPFTEMAFIDEAYNEVKWIELTKLAKPLPYPRELLPQPAGVVPLNELDKARAEAQARAEARKREQERKAREEARKRKAEAEKEAAEKEAAEQAEKEEQARLAKERADAIAAQSSAPASQPRFGLINARPIREIVGKVYTVYKTGGINIENAIFTISLGYEVRDDGSLDQVHIVKSSGSDQIDGAALNIANAISESHALMPLAALTANTATLELSSEQASLKISGSAVNTVKAEELAATFSQQLAGLQLLMNFKNQDAAALLSHLEVTSQGNRLIANLSMTRAEASAMMRKNFGHLLPATDKQPEAVNKNLKNDFSLGSAALSF